MSVKWQFFIDRGGTFTDIVARRPDGTPTQDLSTFRGYAEAIRARSPILQQFSTGGAVARQLGSSSVSQ